MTLDEILDINTEKLHKESYLQDREVDELKKLILTLGKSDIYSQERMIDLAIENLKKLTSESQEDITKKGMVYRKLSAIMGIIVGIILI
jgi:stage III sporulation protein AB